MQDNGVEKSKERHGFIERIGEKGANLKGLARNLQVYLKKEEG